MFDVCSSLALVAILSRTIGGNFGKGSFGEHFCKIVFKLSSSSGDVAETF